MGLGLELGSGLELGLGSEFPSPGTHLKTPAIKGTQ